MAQEIRVLNAIAAEELPPQIQSPPRLQQCLSLSVHNDDQSADDNENNNTTAAKNSNTSEENSQQYLAKSLVELARSGRHPPHSADPAATTSTSSTQSKQPKLIQCGICSKTFSTDQALGGHKSSHRKLDVPENEQKNPPIFNAGEEGSKPGDNSHKCKICHKFFPTGQALGGHKRSHLKVPLVTLDLCRWDREISDTSHSPTAEITASGTTSSYSGSSGPESEEIDLELRLGRRIGLKTKSVAADNHELDSSLPSKKLCLSLHL